MQYTFQFDPVFREWQLLAEGVAMTLRLSSLAIALGFLLGLLCAVARTHGPRWLGAAVAAYVEAVRNTPLLVQLFIIYLGLPSVGLRLSADQAALIGLTLNLGAYASEIVRAGLEATQAGQAEAAAALGLRRWQVLRLVVLPPALQRVWPALTSQFVLLALASSVASAISTEELTAASNLVQSRTFRTFETTIVVAGCYIGVALVLRTMLRLAGVALFPAARLARSGR